MNAFRILLRLAIAVIGLLSVAARAGNTPGEEPDVSPIGTLSVTVTNTNCTAAVASDSKKVVFPENGGCPIKLRITVAGKVDRKGTDGDSSYDMVSINGQLVIHTTTEDICGMKNVEGTVDVEVTPKEPTVTLVYDTVDGKFNKGAAAHVTKVEILKDGCSSCNGGSGGTVSNECVNVSIPIRESASVSTAAFILLKAENPGSGIYSPATLDFHPMAAGTEVIRTNSVLRQILTPNRFVDIATTGTRAYEIKLYEAAAAGTKTGGVYTINTGFIPEVWRFEGANDAGTTLTVTKLTGTDVVSTWTYQWAAAPYDNGWTLTSGSGTNTRKELRYVITSTAQEKIYGHQILDGQDRTIRHQQTITNTALFSGTEKLVRKVEDPAGLALTTTFEYYTVITDSNNYGRLKGKIEPDGSWERYEYDSEGRVVKTVSPIGDAAYTSPEGSCRVVTQSFQDTAPQETTTETVLGVTVARSWTVRTQVTTGYNVYAGAPVNVKREQSIRAAAPGNAWDNSANPITVIDIIQTANNTSGLPPALHGQVCRVLNPDGTALYREFALAGDTMTVTETSGQRSDESIIAGTKTVTVTNWAGQQVSFQEFDVATNAPLRSQTASGFDALGRPTRIDYSDGTYETFTYACCGIEQKVDRDGIVTHYDYDALKRVENETRAGVTTHYVRDADGKLLETVRSGNGLSLSLGQSVYDTAGRLSHTTDATGIVTATYAYADGGRTVTTTSPGGATRIETRYLDGQTKSVSGTAGVPEYYESGVNTDGSRWSTHYTGAADNTAPRWEKTTTDALGQPIRIEKPASGNPPDVLPSSPNFKFQISNFVYNAKGQLSKTELRDQANALLIAPTLYEYDDLGRQVRSGLDVSNNGTLDLTSADRIQDEAVTIEQDAGVWWRVTTAKTYPTLNSSTAVTDSVNKKQLSGLGGNAPAPYTGKLSACVKSIDLRGNETVSRTYTDATATTVWQVTVLPTATTNAVAKSVNGLQTSQTSPSGITTTFGHDAIGRQITVTESRIGTSTTHYNTVGQMDYADDAAGNRTSFGYDAATGRQTTVTNALGKTKRTAYDLQGRVYRVWGDTEYPLEYGYDVYGQQTLLKTFRSVTADFTQAAWPADPGKADVTTWTYEAATGLLLAKTYDDGKGPAYTYDALSHLRTRTWARKDAANQPLVTTYSYDPNTGDLLFTDYSDPTPDVTFTYKRSGMKDTITDAAGTRTMTSDDQLLAETGETLPAAFYGANTAITRGYDAFGRTSTVTLQVPQISNFQFQTSYTYDPATGRTSAVTAASSQFPTSTFHYQYLPDSDLLQTTTFPNGLTRTVGYEPHRNLITTITNAVATSSVVSQFSYTNDAIGRRTAVARAGSALVASDTIVYGYNNRSEVTSATSSLAAQNNYLYNYAYDPIGNRLTTTSGHSAPPNFQYQISNYAANSLNQYTQRTVPGVFDLVGTANPAATVAVVSPAAATSSTAVHMAGRVAGSPYWRAAIPVNNAVGPVRQDYKVVGAIAGSPDRIQTDTGTFFIPQTPETFTYDDDGNLLTDGRWTYTWDAENRLIAMESSVTVPVTRLEFAYDHMSRRIEKKVYTGSPGNWTQTKHTKFIYDDWNLLAEIQLQNQQPQIKNTYTWGLDLSGSMQGAGGVGGLLAVHSTTTTSTQTFFPAYDGNGNVMAYMDAAGATVASFEYCPFGKTLAAVASPSSQFQISNFKFQFSTKYLDHETGLYYYGYRYYNPEIGRWLSRDPLEESGGCNLYCAVTNNFVSQLDLFGLLTVTIVSDKTSFGDFTWWKFTMNSGKVFGNISSNEVMLSTLENYVKLKGEKITTLNLSGHGLSGGSGIFMSEGEGFNIINMDQKTKARLKNILAPFGTIVIWSCGGAYGEKKQNSLQNVSNELFITIRAKNGTVNSGPDGGIGNVLAEELVTFAVDWYYKMDSGPIWMEFRPSFDFLNDSSCPLVPVNFLKKEKELRLQDLQGE